MIYDSDSRIEHVVHYFIFLLFHFALYLRDKHVEHVVRQSVLLGWLGGTGTP